MRVAALNDVHGNLPALEAVLADPRCFDVDVVVCGGDLCAGPMPVEVLGGHTHVQFDRVAGQTRLVNAGSVGMPYEGRSAAFWVLLGPEIELVDTEYDVEEAVAATRATGYPCAGDLPENLLTPPTAEEATAFFEAQREETPRGA